jgi:adenylate kinase family enzyme
VKAKKWIVIGTSGSGKTTAAATLAKELGCYLIDCDNINWLPNWVEKEHGLFAEELAVQMRREAWVMDGNYARVRELTFAQAEAILWLDMGFWTCLGRVFWRTFRRAWTGERLWESQNKESLLMFFSRQGLPWWVISTWRRRRNNTDALMKSGQYPQLRWIRLRDKKQVDLFFATRGFE